MMITYYPESNAVYIALDGEHYFDHGKEFGPNFHLEFDKDGIPIGLEVLGVEEAPRIYTARDSE